MPNKTLYFFAIDEINGDYQHTYYEYLWAENDTEAFKVAREYAETFYDDAVPDGEDAWSTYEVYWSIDHISKCEEITVCPINGKYFSLPVKTYEEVLNA